MNSWELPDPQPALNRLLETLSPDEGRALEAKLQLIRRARERVQVKTFAESDRASPMFLATAWRAILPAAEEARVEMIRAAFDVNVRDDDALIDYVRDEFTHFMGAIAVSFGQSAEQRNVGNVLRQVANLVATARQSAFVASALVRSMRWDRGRSGDSVGGATINRNANGPPPIVLLTVTRHEDRAVLDAFLGSTHVPERRTIDGITYNLLGEHGGTAIIHSKCEPGSGGVGGSQQRAQQAIEHWRPPAIIAVGIAFGVDEGRQAIGEVLVSTQILDYEPARVNDNGTNTPRGDKARASDRLVNRIRQVDSGNQADNTWPKVTFGLVLSGQKLVDNLQFRERLTTENPEAIGGEMEASGVYVAAQPAHVDWIVVKGICDWAHGKNHRQKEALQKKAARNAARVVKATIDAGPMFPISAAPAPATPTTKEVRRAH